MSRLHAFAVDGRPRVDFSVGIRKRRWFKTPAWRSNLALN
jgi:hypothetical protein